MTNDFIYTAYIKSTPEKVWQALTNPEFTRQYWSHDNISDWEKDSDWRLDTPDGTITKTGGKVLESKPPKRLVLSWAKPDNKADESQVVFDISMVDDMVRLDVIHSKLSEEMGRGVSAGWPRVLSSLKSLLETGKALNTWVGANEKCGS